ncbi:MAG: hypothetical protein KatS3mg032_0328 [Cyclobacteriaceae bacterium]|nr:MAG: hypothetical protein KatS3mg032_0328 [Cyclobacteriaceae bacterium]
MYLVDLKHPLPDSMVICHKKIIPPVKAIIPPGSEFKFTSKLIDVRFGRSDLFDTLYFNVSHRWAKDSIRIYTIGNKNIPLKQSVEVTLRPDVPPQNPSVWSAYRINGKGYVYMGGKWTEEGLAFYTRDFGDFIILPDTVPPVITPLRINRNEVRLRISDNLSGINSYEATLNGQWLLLNYDEKTRTLQAEPLVPLSPLNGELVVTVTDNAGNQTKHRQVIP